MAEHLQTKSLIIFKTKDDKYGRDITAMSDFFDGYVQQMSLALKKESKQVDGNLRPVILDENGTLKRLLIILETLKLQEVLGISSKYVRYMQISCHTGMSNISD